jgi:hypothetical protein
MQPVLAGLALFMWLGGCAGSSHDSGPADTCLTIQRFPDQVLLAKIPLLPGGEFSLSFIHSVSLTPVRDEYRLENGKILQISEVFETHGAGLPSGFADTGVIGWEQADGKFIVRLRREIERLVVRTDRKYQNRLTVSGREINLNTWEDQALELTVIPCTSR